MKLRFTADYDRYQEGGVYEVAPQLCPALVGAFAEVADFGPGEVKGEHDYDCLRLMAGHVGIDDRGPMGKLKGKQTLKDEILDEVTDDE